MNLKGDQFMLHLLICIYLINKTLILLEGFLVFSVVSLYANVGE